ncbi:MAG: DUF362 domain-containing protein [bacterium]
MKKITRREFLKFGAGMLAISLVPKFISGGENKSEKAGPIIAVATGNKTKLVKPALDLIGGIGAFVKQGDRVLLKPNISFASNSEWGATTSVNIVKQITELCLSAGASKIIILDYTIQNAELCTKNSSIMDTQIDKKVSILTPDKERQFVEVNVPNGQELKKVKISRELQKVDKLINIPTAKSHSATGVSLGIKNLMGLVWDRAYFHKVNIHLAVAELLKVIKPDLTIVDATRALTSGGPGGPGKTVILNTVIAGIDPVAVDSYTVGITPWYDKSFRGKDVKYIVEASKLGFGEIETDNMNIRKVDVE